MCIALGHGPACIGSVQGICATIFYFTSALDV